MQMQKIPNTDLSVSRIAFGCMGIGGSWDTNPLTSAQAAEAALSIQAALDAGIHFFDHADIYCRGKSEEAFGVFLKQRPGLRQKLVIQTKCGIIFRGDPTPDFPPRYDFSHEHIVRSVEGSLRRLQTDVVDILLLHRPDPLVEPEEVARAFEALHAAGKVRYFGVSNHTPMQIELLKKHLPFPLVVNQLEMNILHNHLANDGIIANQAGHAYTASTGILDYCRLNDIQVQAWSPVAVGRLFNPPANASEPTRRAAAAVAKLAETYRVPPEAIALAWLLRHPAHIVPVIGTTRPDRIAASAAADSVQLSREDWYTLFVAGRGADLP